MAEPVGDAELIERAVMVCPQCEGEGFYADGLDEAACSTECTRCGSNGWIVDLAALRAANRPSTPNQAEDAELIERGITIGLEEARKIVRDITCPENPTELAPEVVLVGHEICKAILAARLSQRQGDAGMVEKSDEELSEMVYLGKLKGYEWFRNKWIGDHEGMIGDLVRCFIPRAALQATPPRPPSPCRNL